MTMVLKAVRDLFRRKKSGKGCKSAFKMDLAVDDVDLIDLESGASCVTRVTVPDATPEEQEHLLDVCPPKLEQKLSLTRRSHDRVAYLNNELDSAGNVLVTLGHDQIVPVRKRIDVVSSDTIKRVRNITKNLEPVINVRTISALPETEDQVDFDEIHDRATPEPEEDVSYEAKEINDAFNFLSELDDNDEPPEQRLQDYSEMLRGRQAPRKEVVSYPLEPTCFVNNSTLNRSFVFDNEAFDSSPPSNKESSASSPSKRPASLNFDFDGLRAAKNSFKRLRSFTCSSGAAVAGAVATTPTGYEAEPWKKRSKNSPHRKSWSEGSSPRKSKYDGALIYRKKRHGSERYCDPRSRGKDKLPSEEPLAASKRSCTSSSSGSSTSSSSEVDWSWVEEIDTGATTTTTTATSSAGRHAPAAPVEPHHHQHHHHHHHDRRRRQEVGEEEEEERRHRRCCSSGDGVPAAAARASAAMSVAAAAKTATLPAASNPLVDVNRLLQRSHSNAARPNHQTVQRNDTSDTSSNVGTLPWLRASMRRLRQLRLLEGNSNANNNNNSTNTPASTQNSLPDIALIAPEILAAQTNDTTGNLLRPSSAPSSTRPGGPSAGHTAGNNSTTAATTAVTAAAAAATSSPRRGRRSIAAAHRSSQPQQQQQQQQHSQRQSMPPTATPRQPANPGRTARSTDSTSTYTSSASVPINNVSNQVTSSASSVSSAPISPNHPVARPGTPRSRVCDRSEDEESEEDASSPLGKWPHPLNPALACLGCTLGLFNISRFAILSIQFGANFIAQFLVLSFLIGIPLFTLQICLGQRLSAGVVDMWKVSPLFQGVGVALLVAQAMIGIYSIVGVSWMFVYFRDSFITKTDRYRWTEPFSLYRDDLRPIIINYSSSYLNASTSSGPSGMYRLHETVPDYFNGVVLQRHHLNEPDSGVVTLKFQVAFNLAVVWMIVFVSLSKGLRSYGKVVYVFTIVPIIGTLLLCVKLLGLTPTGSVYHLFPATVWHEFFLNGRSWMAASSEAFLTWGLLGAAAMQIAAHNKHKHLLQRDASLVIIFTFMVLLLSAFLANTCVHILKYHGYIYTTSSFERISSYVFMRPSGQPAPAAYASTPERFMPHASFLVGQRVTRPGAELNYESGYQVLRLSTELVPATLAILGTELVSPIWAVMFYFILILFGIAQQLAIWHCVITGIMAINTKMMKLWETTITFFSCACGYVLGLPMATELGIYVVYYLDYTIGGGWWIMVLYLLQVGAIFAVRGRPYTGDVVVTELFPPTGRCLRYWAAPLLSFIWNVVLPIGLMIISITLFKSAGYKELFTYRRTNKDYFSVWARQLGSSIEIITVLIVPIVGIIQSCRYLNNGPPDIFDRIQLLYRPPVESEDQPHGQTQLGGGNGATNLHGNGLVSTTTELPFEDPPPKYTPPPSYTTATGARIAKMLRQSFRRSVRRIANVLGEGGSATRHRPALQQQPPPPDYADVLVEMNQSLSSRDVAIHVGEAFRPDLTDTRRVPQQLHPRNQHHRSSTLDRIPTIDRPISQPHRGHYTVDRNRGRPYNNSNPGGITSSSSSNLTAAEVANLLRSSIRRNTRRNVHQNQELVRGPETQNAASVENLVEAAAPIGLENSIPKNGEQPTLQVQKDQRVGDRKEEDDDVKKTGGDVESSVSVI